VAETPDTLKAVTLVADRGVVVSRTDTIKSVNAVSAAELLQQSPDLYVNDQGGAAGLKTVSLRGLGSPHTAIYVDGVRVGNVQSGQPDLGMFGMECFSGAVVDYAQNSISFITARPEFKGRRIAGKVGLTGGSFASFLPVGRIDFKLSESVALSANASGTFSRGDYPCPDGEKRANNDISRFRAGADLFVAVREGDLHVKAMYNQSDRGCPGSLSWPSDDRQSDRNASLQGLFSKQITSRYLLKVSAKGSYDGIAYTSAWGDSSYGQTEFQLNSAHSFNVSKWFDLTAAADVGWDGLQSDVYSAARTSVLAAMSGKFNYKSFRAVVAVEYNGAFDRDGLSRNTFSPSLEMKVRLFEGFDILAFTRRAYRIPTFNELYYTGYGNPELKPEDAWLSDMGVEYLKKVSSSWTLRAKLDGFYNILKNKITSAPSPEDPNVWAPYNIGKVHSAGADVSGGFEFKSGFWKTSLNAKYSYQNARDVTQGGSETGEQLAYIPRHSAVLNADGSYRGWGLDVLWNCRAGRTDTYGDLPDWNTLDISFRKSIPFSSSSLTLSFSAKNVTDCRYELSSGYPMPGRSFLAGLEFSF